MNRTIWLVARRELATRVRSRAFVAGTAAILLVIGVYAGIGVLVSSSSDSTTVGFAGQATAVAKPLQTAMAGQGSPIEVRDVAGHDDGQRQVQDEELDALVTGAPDALTLVVKEDANPELRAALDTIVQQQALDAELAKNGLHPAEIRELVGDARVSVTNLEQPDPESGQRLALATVSAFLLYMFLIMAGQAVAQGVVEEKTSRIVELLLSTIRPAQLLGGKVLGIGLTMLLQFGIITVVGGVATAMTGIMTLPTGAIAGTLWWVVLWFLLGFFFYATILAAAASLVSRMEDLQSVISPVIMVLVVPFVLGMSTLPGDPESPLGAALSLVPGFSPVLMPMRIALGVAASWEIAVAVVLSLLAGIGLLRVGGRIYSNAVLRTGARVKLTEALRS